jgi:hypothetical protein
VTPCPNRHIDLDRAHPGPELQPPGWWNRRVVSAWIEEAVMTMRQLPDLERGWLNNSRSGMPDIVRTKAEMDYSDVVISPGAATPVAIGRFWAVVEWLKWLDRLEQRVVIGMAQGAHARAIGRRMGKTKDQVLYAKKRACRDIATRLNRW